MAAEAGDFKPSEGEKTKCLFYFTLDRVLQPGRHCTHTDTDKSK